MSAAESQPLLPSSAQRRTASSASAHLELHRGVGSFTSKARALALRETYREPLAELLATFLLVLIGDGVVAQTVLSGGANGSWLGINFAWAGAVFLGSYLAGPISGSHINPAVTVSLAAFGGFPWSKVPGYLVAQMLGGFLGAATVYANYYEQIDLYEGGLRTVPGHYAVKPTAGIFSTYPTPGSSPSSSFISELTASFILMLGISAISSSRSKHLSASSAFAVFILMICIGSSFGWQTGYAINAARDLAPRCFAFFVYGGEVFSAGHHYWWIPVVAPIFGCCLGKSLWALIVGEKEEEEAQGILV
ncbi:aquaporin-like protein [Leucosporidium creatinivorum]|uniref:Aquaporin-like protein n=1 Tax=Leucosporidium creatinivorum TaxID=106004 RepID=A0A1Y2G322_9BASI|nr:aquaporin-like protein [Leucosporidium creatinivorum]